MRLSLPTLLALIAVLPACTPRPSVAPPAPAPAPAPPPGPTAEELESMSEAAARRAWEQGTALGRQGRWAEAEERYRTAARLRPLDSRYHMALSTALLNQRRVSEAADALWAGIRADEALRPVNHRVLAVDYERLIEMLERSGRGREAQQARERQAYHRRMRDAQ
jgi:predicted Zn-dependent protease